MRTGSSRSLLLFPALNFAAQLISPLDSTDRLFIRLINKMYRSVCLLLPPFAVLFASAILSLFALKSDAQAIAFSTELRPINHSNDESPTITLADKQASSPAISTSSIASIFTPEVHYWAASIVQWAYSFGLDPNLAAVVMQIESCGNPLALSRSGAIGLFQVMPFHFLPGENPYDPDTNATRGLAYLSRSLEAAGSDARLTLAGYNGGIGVIERSEGTWSDQTRRYVSYGYSIYEDALNGISPSPMLDEWYSHYGASLCRQAHAYLGLP